MNRAILHRVLMVGAVAIATLSLATTANAGWRHWGGYYGGGPVLGWTGYNYGYYATPWGGWDGAGCCDYGSYRPAYVPAYTSCYSPCSASCDDPCYRGCGLRSRISYRWRAHHYGYYWGGYSPYWSASACCPSCGGTAMNCDCGTVEGDVLYGEPSVVPENAPAGPTPAVPPAAEGQGEPTPEKQTRLPSNSALLTVSVPTDARVLVNGVATRSTGDLRRYVSRNLDPGFSYTYEVTTEATINGAPVTHTKTVHLRAGDQATLAFDMQARESVETALTLHVPSDATVYLAGNETRGNGPVRTFRTTKLDGGKEWSQYVVRVTVVRDGENLTKEETITLRAGDQTELTFDFDVDKVAAAP
jgi:uncharacterized protein (TIGR03000 family)